MFQVVARFQDGQVLKGMAVDFSPRKDHFHLLPWSSGPGVPPTLVPLPDLKGLFFVRHLDGNPAHAEKNAFDPTNLTPGKRIRVTFRDGEILLGLTRHFRPEVQGFFLLPADQRSNNERCYVLTAATRNISLL
jgi:hypothetical protein